ncbi:MAG: hypothetical protein BIFFINMI_01612 [Phycisphaerae bacterium]|nr:hypothetical protein [Phycisphaerae bacterium]
MRQWAVRKRNWMLAALLLAVAGVLVQERMFLPGPPQAQALYPADDRASMIDQLKLMNQKLDTLISIMQSGKVKVVVANAEELKAAPSGAGVQAQPAPGQAAPDNEPRVIIRRKGEE